MPHYATDDAFRRALLERLRKVAAASGWLDKDVARAFALQQLTSRVFRSDSRDDWVLTGGTALQYRSTEARPTTDADFAFSADAATLHENLAAALTPRAGEYGTFEVNVAMSVRGQHKVSVAYLIGGRPLARTKLDVNISRTAGLEPDILTPTALVTMPDLTPPPPMRIYPVAQHLADKVTAMYELHGPAKATRSTRPHDLADIVVLSRSSPVDAGELRAAIRAEERRRRVSVPTPLTLPDQSWIHTYPPRVAQSALPPALHDARTALRAANDFLGPVLSGDIPEGSWEPATLSWTAPGRPAP